MGKKKFTQLPIASLPLSGDEIVAIVQVGMSKQTPVSNFMTGGGGSAFLPWSFSDNGGNYPTTGRTVFVSIDEDDAVLPFGTWFASDLVNPVNASDFWTK